jgi:hypothetical protein
VGVTVVLPLGATVPIPLLIVADAALEEVHAKVALVPAVMVAGEAANVTVGAAVVATKPTQLVNKPVAKLKARHNSNNSNR